MIKTILNDYLTVSINTLGAELTSIKTKKGTERLWQKNDTIWNRQAPILFPWTGRMVKSSFSHNGNTFDAPVHGFLRDLEHSIKTETEISVTFMASHTNIDLFPFPFYAEQSFSLNKEKLSHSIKIINMSNETMPFGIGFHPGFICPFDASHQASDYEIVFDSPQCASEVLMDKGHPNGKEKEFLKISDTIQLSDDIFTSDSICLKGLTSKTIELQEKDTTNKIIVSIENFPYVLLWSAATPTLQFVCIEPWHTLPDFTKASSEWTKKENLLKLDAGKTFNSEITMSFFFE